MKYFIEIVSFWNIFLANIKIFHATIFNRICAVFALSGRIIIEVKI
jgi:hypothetical protein